MCREDDGACRLGCLTICFANDADGATVAALDSSCPALCRASTTSLVCDHKDVDGRDKRGHDDGPFRDSATSMMT